MAFTTVSRVKSIDVGEYSMWGMESPYFYPEDIAIVMAQSKVDEKTGTLYPVVSLQCVLITAKVKGKNETKASLAMMGLWHDPEDNIYRRLDHSEAMLALPCAWSNFYGGVFLNKVELIDKYEQIKMKVGKNKNF